MNHYLVFLQKKLMNFQKNVRVNQELNIKDNEIGILSGKIGGINMTYDDAVKYCEEHECEECEVYLKDLDKRSKHEKENLHYPCCVNLVDDDKK